MACDESSAAPSVPALSENGSVITSMQPIPSTNNNSGVILMTLSYLIMGGIIYFVFSNQFSGTKTKYAVVDALYYITMTLSTVGYGDIVPTTTTTKVLVCIFILVGFAFFKAMIDCVSRYVKDLQKKTWFPLNYEVDMKKGTTKVALALGVLIFFFGTGVLVLHFLENSGWIDSTYSSLISMTTIGYGDVAFKTIQGRLLATIWLLFQH
ncbi:Two-pore potassium channel like [Quillaja saponaria]|uniref:Two-pore potassium channel like n=1 Tax=Quillaja saponaria TaxID=32244 RepID=A0AAD7Q1K4_QUISA|nr:Two-pore potassium channel like [Quillaja saponaria]